MKWKMEKMGRGFQLSGGEEGQFIQKEREGKWTNNTKVF